MTTMLTDDDLSAIAARNEDCKRNVEGGLGYQMRGKSAYDDIDALLADRAALVADNDELRGIARDAVRQVEAYEARLKEKASE